MGRSLVITSPTRIKRISLADPTIAEAIVVTPNEILSTARLPEAFRCCCGTKRIRSQDFEVSVDIDIGLAQRIHEAFPTEQVQMETTNDVVMLSGQVSSAAVADKIVEVAKSVTPNVTSPMQIPPSVPVEILLEVKFAEVDRSKLSRVRHQHPAEFRHEHAVSVSTQEFSPFRTHPGHHHDHDAGTTANLGQWQCGSTVSSLLNIFSSARTSTSRPRFRPCRNNNILQILAEPNL